VLRGKCFGKAGAPYPFCVDSGQVGADTYVRRRNWESRCEAPPDATSTAGARRSPRRRDGSASRSLQQPGAHTLPLPPTAIHEHTQQTYFQVSTLDVCPFYLSPPPPACFCIIRLHCEFQRSCPVTLQRPLVCTKEK
jgi:hypothetical protein